MTTSFPRPEPLLAVIVPLFRHPGLVVEALESALAQRGAPPYVILIVIDGCPMPQSDSVCARYVLGYSGRVFALRRQNGGLSAARNAGVRFALSAWPELQAVYFLDADNRIEPRALERLWAALRAGADWAYPDIDMIGMAGNYDYGGRYSPLNHLTENICEAGSLVHRRVFEAGIWFDETLRQGYEDWEFWQRAAARGFRGRHAECVGFRYRRRPESMLAGSDRMREALVATVTRSERSCWRVARALALEHEETPRYAIALTGGEPCVGWVTDARRWNATLSIASLADAIAAWRSDPRRFRCPPYLAIIDRAWFETPSFRALLPGLLWRAEEIADSGAWVTAGGAPCDGRAAVSSRTDVTRAGFALAATSRLLAGEPLDEAACLGVDFRGRPDIAGNASDLLRQLQRLLDPVRALPARAWSWRVSSTQPSSAAHLGLRHLAGGGPLLPLVGERPALGVLATAWPPGRFEHAAEAVLAQLGAHFDLHLVLAGEHASPDERFASISFIGDPVVAQPAPDPGMSYFGAALPALWSRADRHGRLVGLLAGMDAVLNLGVHSLSAVMGSLGALGVQRWLALPESADDARDLDLALGFEHSYERFLVSEAGAGERMRAAGVPAAKVAAQARELLA